MSYNDWHTSETLLTMILPIIILLSCLICFILIGVFMTHGQKKIGIAILSLISFNALLFAGVLVITKDYRELLPSVSYKNRSVEPTLFGNKAAASQPVSYTLDDINVTLSLPFYEKSEQIETSPWSYLGKEGPLYFFKKDSRIYHVDANKELVTFVQTTKQEVEMIRYSAELQDLDFLEAGFKEEVGPTIVSIRVTDKLTEMTYHPEGPTEKLVYY